VEVWCEILQYISSGHITECEVTEHGRAHVDSAGEDHRDEDDTSEIFLRPALELLVVTGSVIVRCEGYVEYWNSGEDTGGETDDVDRLGQWCYGVLLCFWACESLWRKDNIGVETDEASVDGGDKRNEGGVSAKMCGEC